MKNIHIYCDMKKLKKVRLFVVPIFLSISTVISGCSVNTVDNPTEVVIEESFVSSDVEDSIVIESSTSTKPTVTPNPGNSVNPSPTPETNDNSIKSKLYGMQPLYVKGAVPDYLNLLDSNISINSSDMEELKKIISSETYYKYSEYFEVEKALELYGNSKKESVNSSNIIVNNRVDNAKLYETVLRNNSIFIQEGVNQNIFHKYSDDRIKYICNLIANNLNREISKRQIDINLLDYNLSNLKIFQFDKYLYATITKDGCLAINETYIKSLNTNNAFEKTINHECMHLLQKGLTSDNTGVNYRFDELNVNSLYNEWFVETSAEKCASLSNGEELVYTNNMKYLDALIIAKSFSKENIEDVNFDKDLNSFYSLLNCDGLISDLELAKMMYAVNFSATEPDEFLKYYKTSTGKELSYMEIKDLKNIYNSTYYQTLSKILYYDLCKQELKLSDIFSIISLFENSCSNLIWYSDSYKLEYNEEFMEFYSKIQNCYFEILASKLNISKEEVFNLYNYYNETKGIEITFTEHDNMLNNIYSKIMHKKDYGINRIADVVLEQNKRK